ncbi:hypothetical protein F4680DRAFT_411729 [Xylaria scruposa]|nr:hypothetical protein F4680DRAFT_411729 [Xylaria scruposa]
MSHFRPILPAGDIGEPSPKKRDVVSQACHACRKAKAKCDGGRPSCRTCRSRKRQCAYDREKRSSVTALRTRIKVLEQQVGQFRHASQTVASKTQPQLQSRSASVLPQATSSDQLPSIVPQRSLPSISVTQQAVDGFFSSSSKLFHIFTRSQVSVFMESAWNGVHIESQDWKANVCCLMAIAAVGTQYTDTAGDTDASDTFYDISKVYLDSVLEMRPLDAVKIYTLLCMYNIMKKAVASLAYADTGLALCRRFGLHCRRCQLPSLTDTMWMDYRRAFRTLMFLSTWVSATLGYRSGNQYLFEQISPSDLDVSDVSDISEVIQVEMVRIAALKVKILYLNTVHEYLGLAIAALTRELEEWYNDLPQEMRLQEIPGRDLSQDTKRSIYLVHLTYLGTNMLLFRRIAFQKVRSEAHETLPALEQPSREEYLKQADEASLAASGSARIIKIMMDEKCVLKRCCIVIFQSYISCIVLLHAVLGKIALKTQPLGCDEDLENIRCCLSTLSFCGSLDHVAARFHASLLSVYNLLMKDHLNKPEITYHDVDTGFRQPCTLNRTAAVNTTLRSGPQAMLRAGSSRCAEQSLEELSTNLLSMLCRPFGDPINRKESEECLDADYMATPSQEEHQCLMGKLDWDFEDTDPSPRDMTKLGINVFKPNV